jgi:hypothetical protein
MTLLRWLYRCVSQGILGRKPQRFVLPSLVRSCILDTAQQEDLLVHNAEGCHTWAFCELRHGQSCLVWNTLLRTVGLKNGLTSHMDVFLAIAVRAHDWPQRCPCTNNAPLLVSPSSAWAHLQSFSTEHANIAVCTCTLGCAFASATCASLTIGAVQAWPVPKETRRCKNVLDRETVESRKTVGAEKRMEVQHTPHTNPPCHCRPFISTTHLPMHDTSPTSRQLRSCALKITRQRELGFRWTSCFSHPSSTRTFAARLACKASNLVALAWAEWSAQRIFFGNRRTSSGQR